MHYKEYSRLLFTIFNSPFRNVSKHNVIFDDEETATKLWISCASKWHFIDEGVYETLFTKHASVTINKNRQWLYQRQSPIATLQHKIMAEDTTELAATRINALFAPNCRKPIFIKKMSSTFRLIMNLANKNKNKMTQNNILALTRFK